jgi:hypothetical protein
MPSDFQAAFSNGTENGLTRLGTLSAGSGAVSGARGIQNSGSINYFTGYSTVTSGDTHAFYATLTGGSSSVTMTDLGALGTDNCSWGNGINSSLHMVGFSANSNGGACDDGLGLSQKAWYLSSIAPPITLTQISNTLGGTHAAASAINNGDIVAGWADNSSSLMHAFTRSISGTTMTDLGLPPSPPIYDESWAWAIDGNTNPDVAGFACLHTSCGTTAGRVAMLYNGSTSSMSTIGTLPGGDTNDFSEAFAVNNSQIVVGYSTKNYSTNSKHFAFVWDARNGMRYLKDLVSNTNNLFTDLNFARAIDNNGDITGDGLYNDGHTHAFLLTPDAPHTAGFGGRQLDQFPAFPDPVNVPIQPASAQAIVPQASDTASLAPLTTVDYFFARAQDLGSLDWWEWTS